ncbi:MAG TPA: hypothetical protein VF092_27455 [Longimicrobium sp.]
MIADEITTIVDAVTAKVKRLRARWEAEGFEVIEHPGPDDFPFEVGYFGRYRPAMLARRGDEVHVFEVRDPRRMSADRLIQRSDEIRKHPGWHFYLVSLEDVVPFDAPGNQGEPPSWESLGRRVEEGIRLPARVSPGVALVGLWCALEGVLRRIAVDHAVPVDLLPAASLIPILHDQGLIPAEAYQSLQDAREVHRRIVHGYDAPADLVSSAVRHVMYWVQALLPTPADAEQAA